VIRPQFGRLRSFPPNTPEDMAEKVSRFLAQFGVNLTAHDIVADKERFLILMSDGKIRGVSTVRASRKALTRLWATDEEARIFLALFTLEYLLDLFGDFMVHPDVVLPKGVKEHIMERPRTEVARILRGW